VRIIRVIRFAAKLGFSIDPKTRAPIQEMAALLESVPASRTFDEMIKLLQTGHALASIKELRKQGLHRGVFPVLDVALDEAQRHDGREKFVQLALADTDRRVGEGKPVAPSFMLACMLWHDVLGLGRSRPGRASFPALRQASTPCSTRIHGILGRSNGCRHARIWLMQPRFERRTGSASPWSSSRVSGPLRLSAPARRRRRATPNARWWELLSATTRAARADLTRPASRIRAPQRLTVRLPAGEAEPAKRHGAACKPGAGAAADAGAGGCRTSERSRRRHGGRRAALHPGRVHPRPRPGHAGLLRDEIAALPQTTPRAFSSLYRSAPIEPGPRYSKRSRRHAPARARLLSTRAATATSHTAAERPSLRRARWPSTCSAVRRAVPTRPLLTVGCHIHGCASVRSRCCRWPSSGMTRSRGAGR
jgi:poly(A) polymerase